MSLRLFASLTLVLVLSTAVLAEDTAPPAPRFLTPGRTYNYKVGVKIDTDSSAAVGDVPQKFQSVLDLLVRHKVEKGIAAGEVQSTVSVQSATLTVSGEKVQLSPTTFPQVVVITDQDGNVKKVFGGTGPGMPGLNFSNFILFLLPNMAKGDPSQLKEGDQWSKDVTLTGTGQSVKVGSTYKGMQKVGDSNTMLLNQAFELVPPTGQANRGPLKSFKGTAVTNYALPGCAPIKSHADVEVVGGLTSGADSKDSKPENASTKQDSQEFRAKLSIDFAAVK